MTTSEHQVNERMSMCVFMGGNSSYHAGGWRMPDSYADMGCRIDRWMEVARTIEAAKFDALFIADTAGVMDYDNPEVFARSATADRFDPVTVLAALSTVTQRLGLLATVATTYTKPYDLARKIASLDLMSNGRAGWNIVTGIVPAEADLFGGEGLLAPEERYARGEEYTDVVTALWASVEPDAYPRDKQSGLYAKPEKVHSVNHEGKYYTVKGPLSVSASPQGRPILVQAGQSTEGRALCSRVADIAFTAQASFETACDYYKDVKARAAAFGRDPNALKILPGLFPIVGRTQEEADEKEAALNAMIDPVVALAKLQVWLQGIDLSQYPLDGPLPELPESATRGRGSTYVKMAREENLTLRQVMIRASISNAHLTLKGTPEYIVDQLEYWFKNGAADGFNLLNPTFPGSLHDFIELVLPELRRRGLFRKEYEGMTLRENLGVPIAPIPSRNTSSVGGADEPPAQTVAATPTP